MPKKKQEGIKQTNVNVGNVSNISGNVNIAGGKITTHKTVIGLSVDEINQLFDQIYTTIESREGTSSANKEDIKADVNEIQTVVTEAAEKNTKVDEGFLSRRFRNIARMAPDILDVVVAILGSPLAGLGVAIKKIAEKAKEETGQTQT